MRVAALLTALLVILAGCGGVMDVPVTEIQGDAGERNDDGPEPTSTPETRVTVVGDIPVDAPTVFERVLNLTDERVDGPVLYVEEPTEMPSGALDDGRSPFRAALGILPPDRNDSDGTRLAGYAPTDGNAIYVNEEIFDDETQPTSTVAHEFLHVVQFRNEWDHSIWTVDPAVGGEDIDYDGRLTYYLVLEGAAVYVEDRYVQQFVPEQADGSDDFRATYRNASAYERLSYARYVYGAEYVADRVLSPRGLEAVHRDPPASSEQVLHDTTDPVESLTVTTDEVNDWSVRERDRQGELFLRIALRTELNRSTAVDAAAGWGDDRRITFERGNRTATAWTLHWDDAANATAFEAAFERYLDAKATRNGSVWYQTDGNATYRVVEANDETTVVLLGNETFVRGVAVEANQDDVVDVALDGNESSD